MRTLEMLIGVAMRIPELPEKNGAAGLEGVGEKRRAGWIAGQVV